MFEGAWRAAAVAWLLTAAGVSEARAAEPIINFRIPRQSRAEALLRLGEQAGLSIGFPAEVRCPGQAAAVGPMTISQALERLLAGSGCRAVRLDAHTVAIVGAEPPRPAPARPAPVPASVEIGELVVTATKREIPLREAPYGLTAVTARDLERQGAAGDQDLPALAAGVTVTNLGAGRNKLLLRGLSDGPLTGHTQSTVGIYLDDLRLTYNAPDPDLKWVDVARVEVLRGPQGSLYGSGSIGGVLHIVTNPPDPVVHSGAIAASAATTAHGAASGSVEGILNRPLFGGRAAIRLAGWSDVNGGYIDNRITGAADVDRTRRRGFRGAFLWQAGPDLTVTASLIQQAINSRDTHYAQPLVGPLARAVPSTEPHDNDFLALDLALHWTPAWADVTLNTAVLEHDFVSRYDASLAPPSLLAGAGPARTFDDDNDIKGVVSEARIASRGEGRVQWLLGAFGSAGDQDLTAKVVGPPASAGYGEVRRDRLEEAALFGEASYDLSRRLTLTVGGRLFHSAVRTRSRVEEGGYSRDFEGRVSDSGFAPKVVAAYRAGHAVTVYLQAAEGYRSGGFNTSGPPGQTFGDGRGAAEPLRRFAGDELWSYEAGVRWAPQGLRLRAAAFYALWRDIQTDMLLPSGLPFTANIGDGRAGGIELEGSFAHGPFLLAGNLVAQEPELNRPDPGFPGRADSALPGMPKLSYAASASYQRPLSGEWSLDLGARYAYVGRSRLSFDAQTAPSMGDYGDLRLSAAVARPNLRITAFVDNLTDSRGDTFAYGNPFSLRLVRQTTPQRPRTFGLSLKRSF